MHPASPNDSAPTMIAPSADHSQSLMPAWLLRGETLAAALAILVALIALGRLFAMILALPVLTNEGEEEVLMYVVRFLRGEALYGPPTAECISTIYFPLFFVVYGTWAAIFGTGIVAARSYAFVLLLATALLQGFLARRLGARWSLTCAAATWWLAVPSLTGTWNTCISVDTLLAVWLLAGTTALAIAHGRDGLFAASCFFTAAAFTKQNMAPLVAIPFFLAIAYRKDVRTIWMTLAPPLLAITCAFVINVATDGWFFRWTFNSIAGHPFRSAEWYQVFIREIAEPTGFIWLMVGAALYSMPASIRRSPAVVGPLLVVGFLLLVGFVGSLKLGGGVNHMLGYYACLPPLAIGWMGGSRRDSLTYRVAGIFCLAILASRWYDPLPLGRADQQVDYARQFVEYVRDVDGDVLVPCRPYLTHVQAGKGEHFGQNALHGLVYGRSPSLTHDLLPEPIWRAIVERRYAKVICELPTLGGCPLLTLVAKHYVQEGVIQEGPTGPSNISRIKIIFRAP